MSIVNSQGGGIHYTRNYKLRVDVSDDCLLLLLFIFRPAPPPSSLPLFFFLPFLFRFLFFLLFLSENSVMPCDNS